MVFVVGGALFARINCGGAVAYARANVTLYLGALSRRPTSCLGGAVVRVLDT